MHIFAIQRFYIQKYYKYYYLLHVILKIKLMLIFVDFELFFIVLLKLLESVIVFLL